MPTFILVFERRVGYVNKAGIPKWSIMRRKRKVKALNFEFALKNGRVQWPPYFPRIAKPHTCANTDLVSVWREDVR
jgi:hypothetical protein